MRVTKVIREYVEEQVNAKYDKRTNPFHEAAELDRQKIDEFNKELNRDVREAVEEFLKELPLYHRGYGYRMDEQKPAKFEWQRFVFGETENTLAERKWETKNRKEAQEKIKEIILNLELGGTRQELDDMLSALGVEE